MSRFTDIEQASKEAESQFGRHFWVDKYVDDVNWLLNRLIEAEAGRLEAEWEVNAARQGQDCSKLPEWTWTIADWKRKAEKKLREEK